MVNPSCPIFHIRKQNDGCSNLKLLCSRENTDYIKGFEALDIHERGLFSLEGVNNDLELR